MIFGGPLLAKVLDGSKTVTRRPVKYNSVGKYLPCRYKVGKTYAIQPVIEDGPGKGRGGKTIPGYRLRVDSVSHPIPVWPITEAEARLEGFASAADFAVYWVKLRGCGSLNLRVHRIEFDLVRSLTERGER